MKVLLPCDCLVLMVGISGCGKSSFAADHFKPTEIVSSDHYRAVVCDDANDQSASADAFALVRSIVARRLRRGRLTVLDATNLLAQSRQVPIALALHAQRPVAAVVLDLPLELCLARNAARARQVPEAVIREQHRNLQAGAASLHKQCAMVVQLSTSAEVSILTFERDR